MISTLFLVLAFILLTGVCIYPLAFRRGLKLGVMLTLQQIDKELTRLESIKRDAPAKLQGGPDVH